MPATTLTSGTIHGWLAYGSPADGLFSRSAMSRETEKLSPWIQIGQ